LALVGVPLSFVCSLAGALTQIKEKGIFTVCLHESGGSMRHVKYTSCPPFLFDKEILFTGVWLFSTSSWNERQKPVNSIIKEIREV
jgi:hypothetical protein